MRARAPAMDAELDAVIVELQAIARGSGMGGKLAIGELILERFFGGDVGAWRARHTKSQSLRRIAGRPDCPFAKSTLHEAVGIYVATLHLPEVRTFGHVSASHVAAVLPLPVSQQAELLRLAERERWSVRRVKREVAVRRVPERQGPPSQSTPVVDSLRASIRTLREALRSLVAKKTHGRPTLEALRRARAELSSLSHEFDAVVGPHFGIPENS